MPDSDRGTDPPAPADSDAPISRINRHIPHPARIYDYLLGGKDNFDADRKAAEALIELSPGTREGVRAHRAFLGRAVRYLADEAGITQFLDIGTGIPTQDNTHTIAQRAVPAARVAYVDNDPIVLVHGRALLTGDPAGMTDMIEADLRQPEKILDDPTIRRVIDFTRPVAVILAGVMHFITDQEDPYGLVEQFKAAVPGGSHLLLSHITLDFADQVRREDFTKPYDNSSAPMVPRSHDETLRFFAGWDLVDPGLVEVVTWRPDPVDDREPIPGGHAWAYGGVAIKP
ncbi:SAM-dependent methyltransferase [Nonomuraea sp. C10]|uniref:SAM-dependent methyltransferase n=1 Tax=Nonomuraea sp. C10 TaxID=2600577 RepID=UPI0011CE6833|nr:SAM-dependent methyltransferase [Nonomuraea sp. C10]TXK42367.1 SAM-dependent methyltransferase [Nonomuraea sp. C10]